MLLAVLVFVCGLATGSFLNVVAWRVPRGESLLTPRSHCPECGHQLGPLELVPVAGYLFLRGRCRHCHGQIPWRYPLVELGTAVYFLLLYWKFGLSWTTLADAVFGAILVAVSCTDLHVRLIPNRILLAGFLAGLAFLAFTRPQTWGDAFLGLLVAGGLTLLAAEASRGGMGYGDVKLAALIGFYLGWRQGLAALFLAVLVGAVAGIALLLTGAKKRQDHIPFGPFLSLGAFIAVFWGNELVRWYLHLLII